ncbi:MAG: UDP-3-O-(3-hydroxymyristoyl)glucosamine N-acyltransferase [Rhodocyclaceae bacterium]|nr:UDP-3-O-(3-hydroxymyristoyl)glucosamine N-acyltransferase [Rhodocyclaceae bacterium]
MAVRLAEIVARFGGDLAGDGDCVVAGIAPLDSAGPGQLAFLSNPKYRQQLANTRAGAVILAPEMKHECPTAAIVTPQPYLYFARVAQWLSPPDRPASGIHPSAVVECIVPASVSVGPNAYIGPEAKIGESVVIGPHCTVGQGAEVGEGSWLHSNVSIYAHCRVGPRAIVHSGVVIGADGFGFAREADGAWVKIPQTGCVVIGTDVEIGANTTIDRGALEDTVIGDGVKLDNQIQIAHNVRIGDHCALAGCVGIAGSTHIGSRCTMGGGAILLGHLQIADDVHISAGTLVAKSILKAGSYTGTVPFMNHDDWLKNFSRLRHLDALADKIRSLEARLASLENNKQ